MLKMIPINGRFHTNGQVITSRIPVTELNQIIQTNLLPRDIVFQLNEMEKYYTNLLKISDKRVKSYIWKICRECGKIYLIQSAQERKTSSKYCSRRCNGINRKKALMEHIEEYPETMKRTWRTAKGEKRKIRLRKEMMGASNPAWKGGVTYFKTHGNYKGVKYIRCPKEFMEMARKDGYVMEHRVLVAQQIERCLKRTEVVHHLDHNPTNNKLENLVLYVNNKDHKLHEHGHPIKPLWQLSLKNIMKD